MVFQPTEDIEEVVLSPDNTLTRAFYIGFISYFIQSSINSI